MFADSSQAAARARTRCSLPARGGPPNTANHDGAKNGLLNPRRQAETISERAYQGVALRLLAAPKAPIKRLLLRADLAGTRLTRPMRPAEGVYAAAIPAKATKGRRGQIVYEFEVLAPDGSSTIVRDPTGERYRVRLVPKPAASLLAPGRREGRGRDFCRYHRPQ